MNRILGRGNPAGALRYWTVEPHRHGGELYLEVNLHTLGYDEPFTLVVRHSDTGDAIIVPSLDVMAVTGEFLPIPALESWLRHHPADGEDIFSASFRNGFLLDQLENYLSGPMKRVVKTYKSAWGDHGRNVYGDFTSQREEFTLAMDELVTKVRRAPLNLEKRMKRITRNLEG